MIFFQNEHLTVWTTIDDLNKSKNDVFYYMRTNPSQVTKITNSVRKDEFIIRKYVQPQNQQQQRSEEIRSIPDQHKRRYSIERKEKKIYLYIYVCIFVEKKLRQRIQQNRSFVRSFVCAWNNYANKRIYTDHGNGYSMKFQAQQRKKHE